MDALKADLKYLNSLTYKDLPITYSNSSDMHYNFGGCECNGLVCTCCALVEINEDKSDYKMKKNQSVCLSYTYKDTQFFIKAKEDIFKTEPLDKTISAYKLSDVCYDSASFCLHFYNTVVSSDRQSFTGCSDIIYKSGKFDVAQIKLGCFRMALGSKLFVREIVSFHNKTQPAIYMSQENTQVTLQDSLVLPKFMVTVFSSFNNGSIVSINSDLVHLS